MIASRMLQMFLIVGFSNLAGWSPIAGQILPVPNDPLEPVTSIPVPPDTQERAAASALLMRAAQNGFHGLAYTVKSTFVAYGPVSYTGPGDMEETMIGSGARRWTGHLGDFTLARLLPGPPQKFDLGSKGPIPMRMQMVRHTLLAPIERFSPAVPIRIANASVNGTPVTCILAFGAGTTAPGRDWSELEYCIDPQTGLLRIASDVPGIYAVYDYGNSVEFNRHTVASQITVFVAGAVALQQTLSFKNPDPVDPALWTPTKDMFMSGVNLVPPTRRIQKRSASPTSAAAPPVIVHATLAMDGSVVEAEALQVLNSSLSQSALDLVKNTNYGPAELQGSSPIQREIYVTVQ